MKQSILDYFERCGTLISKFGFETVLQALVLKHQAQRSDSTRQKRQISDSQTFPHHQKNYAAKPPASHVLEQSQSASNFFAAEK